MQQLFEHLEVFFKSSGIQAAQVLVTAVGGALLIHAVHSLLTRMVEHNPHVDSSAARFVLGILRALAWAGLVIAIIVQLGFRVDALLSQAGLLVAALALALQNEIVSIVNGIKLVVTQPFKQGDHVEAGGVDAVVRTINLFSTEFVTYDNKVIRVPNASVVGGTIINYSSMPTRRIEAIASVAYGSDLATVKRVLAQAIQDTPKILKTPAPVCRMSAMSASSLDFTVLVWVYAGDFVSVKSNLLENIYNALNANGLEIPFNQLDVHLRDLPPVQTVLQPPAQQKEAGHDA